MNVQEFYPLFLRHRHLSTDSRRIQKGDLFFALRGENFDGNTYTKQALEAGASYCVIDNPQYNYSEACIVVENVLQFLQALAHYHRQQFSIPFIGITGSNGKTTTKELIAKVLSKRYKTHFTQGNLNNHIGVPLTLLTMPDDTEIAVIEMGANKIGDIAELCGIANPTHGAITNIGHAHIEGFGSFEGVLRGKTELYQHLITHQGHVFINALDELLSNMSKRFENPILYGREEDFSCLTFMEVNPYIRYQTKNSQPIQTQLIGKYNFANIQLAVCIGLFFGIEETLVHEAIQDYIPSNQRSQVVEKETNSIILDAYNANPSSMGAALENFAEMNQKHKVVILGDMLELGHLSEAKHKEIIEKAQQMPFERIIVCGKDFWKAAHNNPHVLAFETKQDLHTWLYQNPIRYACVLIKGSRGMGLETTLTYL